MKYLLITCISLFALTNATADDLKAVLGIGSGLPGKKSTITLSITGGVAPYTVTWSGPSGYSATGISIDSLGIGTYCATVIDKYCGEAHLCVDITNQNNGIKEVNVNPICTISPNPFTNTINISFQQAHLNKIWSLTLLDLMGRVVVSTQLTAGSNSTWAINKNIATGTYILHLINNQGEIFNEKIIKVE